MSKKAVPIIKKANFSKKFMNEFKVTDFLTLKLEEGKTNIYIARESFDIPKFLMFNIYIEDFFYVNSHSGLDHESIDKAIEMQSLDDVIEKLGWVDYPEPAHQLGVGEGCEIKYDILPETEFWGFCSNLQVWAEHEYDTHLLHTRVAFPILKKLVEKEDPDAIEVFSKEILTQFQTGNDGALEYLLSERYYEYLDSDETVYLLLALKTNTPSDNFFTEIFVNYAHENIVKKARSSPLFRLYFSEILDYFKDDLELLIDDIKNTSLYEEKLSEIIKSLEKIGDDIIIPYDYFRIPFESLLNSIKGTKLIIESFGDILHIFEKGFDYPEGLFLLFLEALKEGNVLQTIFPDLLKFLETTKIYDYHLDLINGVKGTKLLNNNYDRIMNLVYQNELRRYDGIECIGIEYFSKLVTAIKETEIIESQYTKIRERFQSILIGIKEYLQDYDEIYEEDIRFFYNLISAIKGTELLGEFFLDILHLFDDFYSHEELDASKLFTKFTQIVLEDPAFESNFRDILSSLERMPNYYKKKATSKLIELIKGTENKVE